MKRIIAAGAGCVLVSWNAGAQPAPPQMRTPWVDSTHITGVAKRVMPDSAPPPVDPVPVPPSAPTTVQELLDRMDGAELYFREVWDNRSGWNELPSTLRIVVRSSGAEVQAHNQWQGNWFQLCTLLPWSTRCTISSGVPAGTGLLLDINGSQISISGAHCVSGYYGNASAWAMYSWENYRAQTGYFANRNRWLESVNNGYSGYFLQSGSFSSSCFYEMPG